jgi:hypothetical protein
MAEASGIFESGHLEPARSLSVIPERGPSHTRDRPMSVSAVSKNRFVRTAEATAAAERKIQQEIDRQRN